MNSQPSPKPPPKTATRRVVAGYAIASVCFSPFIPLCEWLTVGPAGNQLFQEGILLAALAAMASCYAVGAGLLMLVFPSHRKLGVHTFGLGAVILLSTVLGLRWGNDVRMAAFRQLGVRSQPIILAIREFEQQHKRPPKTLEELVPRYLPTTPKTGMAAYPEYEYVEGERARDYDENPWALFVPCSSGGMNWDIFLYLPKQNYPGNGYGGSLQRVGDWAYVHE